MIKGKDRSIALAAGMVVILDQLSKLLVLRVLGFDKEFVVFQGFFKFVHWGNTGAAWSLFRDNNDLLAIVSLIALLILFLSRRQFESGRLVGDLALGLLFGGIIGNLIDRLHENRRHVVDFIYFYLEKRGGGEIGFPAFNIADSAICIGVGLLFLLSWTEDQQKLRVEKL